MDDCESEELQARISAYINNQIDVAVLQEDSQTKAEVTADCEMLRSKLSLVR